MLTIPQQALRGDPSNTFLRDRVELVLRELRKFNVRTLQEAQVYLGSRFRDKLEISKSTTDEEVRHAIHSKKKKIPTKEINIF